MDSLPFADFYALYPRHVARAAAEKAWKRLTPDEQRKAIAVIQKRPYSATEPRFIPHPATWLNGKRWQDEPDPGTASARYLSATETKAKMPFESPEMPSDKLSRVKAGIDALLSRIKSRSVSQPGGES